MEIRYSPKFKRQYKKLSEEIKSHAEKREAVFRKNPFDPRLKTHKLHGSQDGFMSFSVDYSYRIIFEFYNPDTVIFYEIGTHDIYEWFFRKIKSRAEVARDAFLAEVLFVAIFGHSE